MNRASADTSLTAEHQSTGGTGVTIGIKLELSGGQVVAVEAVPRGSQRLEDDVEGRVDLRQTLPFPEEEPAGHGGLQRMTPRVNSQ